MDFLARPVVIGAATVVTASSSRRASTCAFVKVTLLPRRVWAMPSSLMRFLSQRSDLRRAWATSAGV